MKVTTVEGDNREQRSRGLRSKLEVCLHAPARCYHREAWRPTGTAANLEEAWSGSSVKQIAQLGDQEEKAAAQ